MSFFQPQNPGIGGLDELTDAEEIFLTTFAGLSYNDGDYLQISGSSLAWAPPVGVTDSLAIAYAIALG